MEKLRSGIVKSCEKRPVSLSEIDDLVRDIERRLVMETLRRGGVALKFVSPGCAGVPDRIVMMPGGKMGFAELKAPGETERPLQEWVQDQIRRLGFTVYSTVDGPEAVDRVLEDCQRALHPYGDGAGYEASAVIDGDSTITHNFETAAEAWDCIDVWRDVFPELRDAQVRSLTLR